MDEEWESVERGEVHPADRTFRSLQEKALYAAKILSSERERLHFLLTEFPETSPNSETEQQIQSLKQSISQKHDELMEILKFKEKISREIPEKPL